MMKYAAVISLYVTLLFACLPALAWQTANSSIRYCVDPNWAPYESIVDGQHIGLSKQYLSLIEKHSTFTFTLVPTENWQQTLAYLKNGSCDLLPMLNRSKEREQYLSFSDIVFRAPNALYAHYDQPLIGNLASIDKQTVAVVDGYRMHHYLVDAFPNMRVRTVSSEADGLNKVDTQVYNFYVGSFHAANKYIKENALSNLRIVGIAELEDHLRIGVSKRIDEIVPALNAAIQQITPEEHANVFAYINSDITTNKQDNSFAIKSAIVLTAITICLGIGYWRSVINANTLADKNKALERAHTLLDEKNKQLADLAIRDPLTKIYNRSHLAEAIQQQIKLKDRYGKNACLLVIDIDDFKQINDQHGHKMGDDILCFFANLLKDCARESDIVARWGGEEFVMLCPETGIDEAKIIACRFQKMLIDKKNDTMPYVTCSIGIASLNENKDADQWFIAADNAMYQAKTQGKDTIFIIE